MSAIDILIILLFLGSLVYGYYKGVITQLGAVGGIFIGIAVCRLFGHPLTAQFAGAEPTEESLYVSGVFVNVILFIVAYVASRLIARLIKAASSSLSLSFIDRLGGAAFSLFEWFFILSLLLNVWQALKPGVDVTQGSTIGQGRAAKVVMQLAPKVIGSDTAQNLWDALPETRK
jgi:uncharacterized membrane protein required for colicin V production